MSQDRVQLDRLQGLQAKLGLPADFRNIRYEIEEADLYLASIRADLEKVRLGDSKSVRYVQLEQTAIDLCSRNEAALKQLLVLVEYVDGLSDHVSPLVAQIENNW